MAAKTPGFIVGIGGSAGGLYAYTALLDTLSINTGMAFVIVSHILPTANNMLAELLASHTKMPVNVISSGMQIEANNVYVIPPNVNLLIDGEKFKLESPRTQNRQIDVFLISLAKELGSRSIGVIVSGYDGDGSEGCKYIKAKGGITFAQDISANVSEMPHSANASGYVDYILPPDKISKKLKKIADEFKA